MSTPQSNDKETRFVVMVPVEFEISKPAHCARLFGWLKDAGAGLFSTDGCRVNIRTDKLRLRDIRAAYKSALENRNGQ